MVRCPNCESPNVQKSSAMYDQGTRVSEGTSKGFFVTSGGTIGVGQSSFRGQSSTLAAEKSAPPVAREPLIAVAVCTLIMFSGVFIADSFFGILAWLFVTGIITMVVVFVMLLMPSTASKDALKRWANQWYCKTCGQLFEVDDEGREFSSVRSMRAKASTKFGQGFVSPVRRAQTNHSRGVYIDRVVNPVQRATELSERDEAGILEILKVVEADGSFDPRSMQLDLGIASRLSSLKVISYDKTTDRFTVLLPGKR